MYRTVDWQLFLLSPLKISFHCLLASIVSVENLAHVILARLLDFQDFQFSAEFLQVVFISLNLLRIAVLSLFWIIPIFGSPVYHFYFYRFLFHIVIISLPHVSSYVLLYTKHSIF